MDMHVIYLITHAVETDFVHLKNVGVMKDIQERIVKQNNYNVQIKENHVEEILEVNAMLKDQILIMTA